MFRPISGHPQVHNLCLKHTEEGLYIRKMHSSGSEEGAIAGFCEYGNEPSGSIKCGEFLDQLTNCCLFKTVSAA
jgi:hypothetical protein